MSTLSKRDSRGTTALVRNTEVNGHYYFTKKQLEKMLRGKEVRFKRRGKWSVAGLKQKHKMVEIDKLQHKLEYYKNKLKAAGVAV